MTAFFDERELRISNMLVGSHIDEAIAEEKKLTAIILEVMEIENFPDDLAKQIEVCIDRYKMDGPRGREWAESVKSSRLAQGFHTGFHDLARRRIEMPFGAGRFFDSPSDILYRYKDAKQEFIDTGCPRTDWRADEPKE